MKVSLSWLKEYVPINLEVDELADALTMAGLEIEAVEDRYAYLASVVVARVAQVVPHPNADRLNLCAVDAGGETLPVVCGAPNVAEGMRVPLAMVGAELPNGIVLKKSKIRGEVSQGMLCSAIELELGTDSAGLMELSADLPVGQPLKQALKLSDYTLEIGLTPNRPDCLSMIGVAREIAAILGVELSLPDPGLPDASGKIEDFTSVTIEAPDHCPRYAARLLDNISVAPSPHWLQDRLRSVGVRPINNLVDITNFVMMETGQPLHAFDFDNLAQDRIVVRTADEGEAFTTLDGKKRKLGAEMLMICDGEKPVAVGGVMGGLNSEIEETTTRVLIESACFDAISVRKTAKALGLSTDASHRFERGVDPDGTLVALDRAAALMAELGDGRLIGGVVDEDYRTAGVQVLDLSAKATNRLLGIDLPRDQMATLLASVGFASQLQGEDGLQVQVPSFRVDVSRPQDLMEEVARLSGYNRIPTTFPSMPSEGANVPTLMIHRNRVREVLSGFGFAEAINYSFISAASDDRIRLAEEDARRSHVELLNPISEEQAVMRTTLVPGMLEAAGRNIARQQTAIRLFEVGKVFLAQAEAGLPQEKEMLVGLWSGPRARTAWHTPNESCDFYDIKGVVEALAAALGIGALHCTAMADDQCPYLRYGHAARILLSGQELGVVGQVHDAVADKYSLKQAAFIFELDLEQISRHIPQEKQMAPIPRYPSTSRDITLIVDQALESSTLLSSVLSFNETLVEDVRLFDVFSGKPIPEEKKSVSIRVVYRSADRTLKDKAVNKIHQQLTQRLISECGAQLPG